MFERTAAALVLLAFCVRFATPIRCYDCNSVNNSMCLDPTEYDEETLVKFLPAATCGYGVVAVEHPGFFCRKIVQTILNKGFEPEVRVTRGCGWVRHHKDCYKADNEDHLETVCQCFSDGCNAASAATSAAVLVLMTAVGAFGKTMM